MDTITAEQAAEAAKGLTFEIVWAALMENRRQMEKTDRQIQETGRQLRESKKRMDEETRESRERTDRILAELKAYTEKTLGDLKNNTEKTLGDLSKNIGGLNNSLGRLSESMFSVGLDEKFNELGYPFTRQGPNVTYKEKGKIIAEADYMLENGEYAMAVEVKTELKEKDIDDHLQRIAAIRGYYDARGDKRILVGAVAGVMVSEKVLKYAHGQGLYVIVQTGDNAAIADTPQGFKAGEW